MNTGDSVSVNGPAGTHLYYGKFQQYCSRMKDFAWVLSENNIRVKVYVPWIKPNL